MKTLGIDFGASFVKLVVSEGQKILLKKSIANEKYSPSFLKNLACGFVLGGALGNLTDRLLYGNVIDFIDCHWRHYHWPAFNVADSAVTIGMFLLALKILKEQN